MSRLQFIGKTPYERYEPKEGISTLATIYARKSTKHNGVNDEGHVTFSAGTDKDEDGQEAVSKQGV